MEAPQKWHRQAECNHVSECIQRAQYNECKVEMNTLALHGNVPRCVYWATLKDDEEVQGNTAAYYKAANNAKGDLESSIRKNPAIKQQDAQFDCCDRGVVKRLSSNDPLIKCLVRLWPYLILITYFSERFGFLEKNRMFSTSVMDACSVMIAQSVSLCYQGKSAYTLNPLQSLQLRVSE